MAREESYVAVGPEGKDQENDVEDRVETNLSRFAPPHEELKTHARDRGEMYV